MPLAEPPGGDDQVAPPGPPSTTVAPSAAVELYWATAVSEDGTFYAEHALLRDLQQRRPDLVAGIRDFWGHLFDACCNGNVNGTGRRARTASFPELLVLADAAGTIDCADFDRLLASLAAAASRPLPPPRLGSETAADRRVIGERLAILADNPATRRAWLAQLESVAAEVTPRWEQVGRAVSQRACRARSSQLPWADDVSMVQEWAGSDYGGLLDRVLRQAGADAQPILVVPSYLSGRGVLFDLPRHLLVGLPAQPGPKESLARAEPLAKAIKALSDPTRLAMVDYLVGAPRTVGELARDFGLAQPTVSRHVRLLRDAGLLTQTRSGNSVVLGTDREAVAALMGEVSAALVTRRPA